MTNKPLGLGNAYGDRPDVIVYLRHGQIACPELEEETESTLPPDPGGDDDEHEEQVRGES